MRAQQFTNGFPVIGHIGEAAVFPVYLFCNQPELAPDQSFGTAKRRIKARMSRPVDPDANQLRGEAADQVEKGWFDGPCPSDDQSRLLTGEGPQDVNPAFRFGAQQGEKLRAADDLKRSRANAAAAIRAPANLPLCDHFGAEVGMFQEGQTNGSTAFALAGHRAAYKQLPVCEERENPAAGSLRGQKTNKPRCPPTQTQFFGVAAASLNYNTVPWVMATQAARWLKIVRVGYFDDFCTVAKGSRIDEALKAFTQLDAFRDSDLEDEEAERGFEYEFLGATARFSFTENAPEPQPSLDRKRAIAPVGNVKSLRDEEEAFSGATTETGC